MVLVSYSILHHPHPPTHADPCSLFCPFIKWPSSFLFHLHVLLVVASSRSSTQEQQHADADTNPHSSSSCCSLWCPSFANQATCGSLLLLILSIIISSMHHHHTTIHLPLSCCCCFEVMSRCELVYAAEQEGASSGYHPLPLPLPLLLSFLSHWWFLFMQMQVTLQSLAQHYSSWASC